MAGGDHHAANGMLVFNGVRHRRRGRWAGSQDYLEAVAREHLSRALAKSVREEAPVVPDDDPLFGARHRVRRPVFSRRLRDARDISKGKLVRDDRPPTVRAEFDAHIVIVTHRLARGGQALGLPQLSNFLALERQKNAPE